MRVVDVDAQLHAAVVLPRVHGEVLEIALGLEPEFDPDVSGADRL